jgi:ribosome biogenesis GTPase
VSDQSHDALVPLGWGDRVQALYDEIATATTRPGRVVRVARAACFVATREGETLASADPLPVVGDWVAVDTTADRVVVLGVVTRWSALIRQDPSGDRAQVLAANVDLVLVTAPADRPSAARVERESLIAWESGTRPVIVVTKTDLDRSAYADELATRLVGVDVVSTSATTGDGVAEVAALLQPCHTAVLLGPSGAGKSTLANALLGEDAFATAAVRGVDARGRHTTTSRQLVPVPTGGVLIDTPGVRSLGLWGGGQGIDRTFADIAELATRCRFADCRHEHEPGCAVIAAVTAGDLDPDRLASFRKLERELAWERRRVDPVARDAERRRRKAIHKEQRRRYRDLGRDR